MKILAMDSTATAASVALMEDGCLLGEFYMNVKLTHSQTLLPMAEQLLACTQVALQDIGLFAVSAGPGSFTGVRIGVSAVKGLALAQSKPCVGVSTLEAMAYNAGQLDGIACCLMDARCGQVYGALFEVGGGRVTRLTEDAALPAEEDGHLGHGRTAVHADLQIVDTVFCQYRNHADRVARYVGRFCPRRLFVKPPVQPLGNAQGKIQKPWVHQFRMGGHRHAMPTDMPLLDGRLQNSALFRLRTPKIMVDQKGAHRPNKLFSASPVQFIRQGSGAGNVKVDIAPQNIGGGICKSHVQVRFENHMYFPDVIGMAGRFHLTFPPNHRRIEPAGSQFLLQIPSLSQDLRYGENIRVIKARR